MNTPDIGSLIAAFRKNHREDGSHTSWNERVHEAIAWIERAHAAAGGNGISKGYHLIRNYWYPAYPETTGYTVPTLLNAAAVLERPDLNNLALNLSDYLLECATAEGGVAHWDESGPGQPIIFDTGQVIFGWLAAYEFCGKEVYLDAAAKAGDWLVKVQEANGSWTGYQHLGVAKTIDSRVDWSLLRLYQHTSNEAYIQAARKNLNWVLQQQDDDGWFNHCSFLPGEDPITHTLAYTAEGLVESGLLLDDTSLVEASYRTAEALLKRQRADGALASTFGKGWHISSRSTCLTGNCQMAIVWMRLFGLMGNGEYHRAARSALAFVVSTQNTSTSAENIRGAIAGSHPVYGRYERFKYPNWAVKFFIDAVLTSEKHVDAGLSLTYVG